MAESGGSLLLKNQEALRSLHAALDPKSLILSKFSNSDKPYFIIERGPRYKEYADLRERRLRNKISADKKPPEKERYEKLQNRSVLTPARKQVKFSTNFTTPPKRAKGGGSSILTQSTPDFISTLRKENRKPAAPLPPVAERWMTPPAGAAKSGKVNYGGGGSKSAYSAEKRSGGLTARKSYASKEEFKGLFVSTGNPNRGEHRISKTVLGC
ncbi:hypothetical protein CDL12_03166 [Handroanthus impetiginosus]|uniref:Uncharacterized protein n=1 Tax=Handroanthus impetiginosus TaxID=429701 RepID=A0A2G9I2X3_9LAMI|nr:hypothetical protein CDL12_03166 [Handroanthus impetiginosus]